ncbi:hypothetical protein EV356DRAFT_515246 [Viridothelium virens]|uniref:Uncharacterized protein n=1 Tax=Viridothelium virens TaxID=1048519 RepID=A0A6A6H8C2_VIRVR|nr:hypothetical protein EV356DRAFT_515246 [Viridothelium virens]
MGHSSRRSRYANQSTGPKQAKRSRVRVGSKGSPVRDGSGDSAVQLDEASERDRRRSEFEETLLPQKQEEHNQRSNATEGSAPAVQSRTAYLTAKANPNARAAIRDLKLRGTSRKSLSQTSRDIQAWEEHFARCLGEIPGLEQFSSGATKIVPDDVTPSASGGNLGLLLQNYPDDITPSESVGNFGTIPEDFPDRPNRNGTRAPDQCCVIKGEICTEPSKQEWQLRLIEADPLRAQREMVPKQSRFFPIEHNSPSRRKSSSPPTESRDVNKDLFWEVAARESRQLYGKKELDIPADEKDIRTDGVDPSQSAKLKQESTTTPSTVESNHALDNGWTLLQPEEAKSPSCESLHTSANESRIEERVEPDVLCKECEWPGLEDEQGPNEMAWN